MASRSYCQVLSVLVGIVIGLGAVQASAQSSQVDSATRVKLEAAANLLKAGDTELAVKTFNLILDADPTNWQARSLLMLAHLSTKDMAKAQTELQRLKVLKAPADTVTRLERQVSAIQERLKLRDDLVALLQAGKWREGLDAIDKTPVAEPNKQLLRAYIAVMRGDFEAADRLTRGPEAASFNAGIVQRDRDFRAAREKALVALTFLSYRYCGYWIGEMRRCGDQTPSRSAVQDRFWEDIRTGQGKVSAQFIGDKGRPNQDPSGGAAATRTRVETALPALSQLVALAPLHPDSLMAQTVLALYANSRDALRAAAFRSISATGVWALKIRNDAMLGTGGKVDRPMRKEGLLLFDPSEHKVRYLQAEPQDWLTQIVPETKKVVFEIPFDQIKEIVSTPKTTTNFTLEFDATFLDFGHGHDVPMLPDFMYNLATGYSSAAALKGIEDITNVIRDIIPTARVEYKPEIKTGGSAVMKGLLVASAVSARASGDLAGAQMLEQQLQQQVTADENSRSAFWRTVADLKANDGVSMVNAAFEDEGMKKEIEALLTATIQSLG